MKFHLFIVYMYKYAITNTLYCCNAVTNFHEMSIWKKWIVKYSVTIKKYFHFQCIWIFHQMLTPWAVYISSISEQSVPHFHCPNWFILFMSKTIFICIVSFVFRAFSVYLNYCLIIFRTIIICTCNHKHYFFKQMWNTLIPIGP